MRRLALPAGVLAALVMAAAASSTRMNFAACSRVHPVFGNDYSSFCLK